MKKFTLILALALIFAHFPTHAKITLRVTHTCNGQDLRTEKLTINRITGNPEMLMISDITINFLIKKPTEGIIEIRMSAQYQENIIARATINASWGSAVKIPFTDSNGADHNFKIKIEKT